MSKPLELTRICTIDINHLTCILLYPFLAHRVEHNALCTSDCVSYYANLETD
jgi:hypothetical protein